MSLMDQYRPAGKVGPERYRELDRRPASRELAGAREVAERLGLRLDERGGV